ncbi:hypothetical protein BgAZ_111010 [Babesia gibsoni]|uniref:Nuclear speckle splicing regulatory protein 1 N-terminal domain-containing protein n=1 Tax=Babesia gibsoni TaxID=33632 RepID=A0AAD8USY2_BABGI|nr:hypothetical protein BgAZ_111010 [Babesia gibsoni]
MAISFKLSTKSGDPSKGVVDNSKKAAPTGLAGATKPSIFNTASDEEDSNSDSLGKHPLSKRAKVSTNGALKDDVANSVAAECQKVSVKYKEYDLSTENLDPELYQYDSLEESSKDDREYNDPKNLLYLGCAPSQTPQTDVKRVVKDSQYMKGLLRTARDRQIERSIAIDKQQLKEDLETGEAVGEVFVTGAYKRKLEERKRFEEEQRRKDEEDLLKSGKSVASLHAHMLKSGIASRTNRRS